MGAIVPFTGDYLSVDPPPKNRQKDLLIASITAVAIGVIVAIVGILILNGIPQLSQLGTTNGWILYIGGCFFILLGGAIGDYRKKQSNSDEQRSDAQKYEFVEKDLKRIDSSVPLNACKILNIPEDRMDDVALITTQHGIFIESLRRRQSKVSPAIAYAIGLLIQDVEGAYETLRTRAEAS